MSSLRTDQELEPGTSFGWNTQSRIGKRRTNQCGLRCAWLCLAALLIASPASTQNSSPAPRSFTFEQAVNYALANYPAVSAALEQAKASQAGTALARTHYLPTLNSVYQADRATQNQVDGIFLPSSITPSVEGPA